MFSKILASVGVASAFTTSAGSWTATYTNCVLALVEEFGYCMEPIDYFAMGADVTTFSGDSVELTTATCPGTEVNIGGWGS